MSTAVADPPADGLLLTKKEAASLMRITVFRLMELYRSGQITAVPTSGTAAHPRGLRFTRESLQKFIDAAPKISPPSAAKRKGGAA